MANFFVNGSTAFDAATFGKILLGDTETNGFYSCMAWRINYDGANWVVSTTHGSIQSASDVAPVWNAGDNRLDITLSLARTFTNNPCVLVSPMAGTTHASQPRYDVQAYSTAATTIVVRFIDLTAPTNYVTALSTKMAFNMLVYGPNN